MNLLLMHWIMSVCSHKQLADLFVMKFLKSNGFGVNGVHTAHEMHSPLGNRVNI